MAATQEAQRQGLSGRDDLPPGTGMLFTFPDRSEQRVWMAGMEISIDAAWIVDDQVLSVRTLAPCLIAEQGQCPRWPSLGEVDALLEVPAGALEGIYPGAEVTIR